MAKAPGDAADALVSAGYPALLCRRCSEEKHTACLRLVLESLAGCAQTPEGAGAAAALSAGGVEAILAHLAAGTAGPPSISSLAIVESAARALAGLAVAAEGKAAIVTGGGCKCVASQLEAICALITHGGCTPESGDVWTHAMKALGQVASLASLAAVDDAAKRGLQEAGAVKSLAQLADPSVLLGGTGGGDSPVSAGGGTGRAGSELVRKLASEAPRSMARSACLAAAQVCRALSAVCALPLAREQALAVRGDEAVARALLYSTAEAGGGAVGASGVLLKRASEATRKVLLWKP